MTEEQIKTIKVKKFKDIESLEKFIRTNTLTEADVRVGELKVYYSVAIPVEEVTDTVTDTDSSTKNVEKK